METLSGKYAIVTGGTRGIGRAIAIELAQRGADVAFNYAQSVESAESLKSELEGLGVRALAFQCNVGNTEAAAEMAERAWQRFLNEWTWDAIRSQVCAAAQQCLKREAA